ncbi:MAG: YdcF family protein [Burkholderiales bacterium]|nr:YdcF family protein [Burkholderiales bacterium]
MNGLFVMLGIETWKPVLTALLLPPVPFLLLLLLGARLLLPRRGLGWLVILLSVAMMWLSSTTGAAQFLSQFVLHPPGALTSSRIKELKAETRQPAAIVVLGSGMEPYAPEYGVSNLTRYSVERLRYGIWLGRETGIPVAFSGGVGWASPEEGKTEAQVASQIAAQEFGRPLKWLEDKSRDTRENAAFSIALLKPLGIKRIVLVTHGWHMPRAVRAFEEAAGKGSDIEIEAAPMGLARAVEATSLTWIPSTHGITEVRNIVRELYGRIAGA